MIGHECVECGATVAQCDDKLRQSGEACCAVCFDNEFVNDAHGLLTSERAMFDRIETLEHDMRKFLEHAAAAVIWRREIHVALNAVRARIDLLEKVVAMLGARNDHIEDRNQLLADVRQEMHGLPGQVDYIDRCLQDIEKRLKLRRRPQMKELMP